MAGMATIGNVLNASVAARLPYYSFTTGSAWDDAAAADAIRCDTGGSAPISGDTVRISSRFGPVFDETRIYDGSAWVAMSSTCTSWNGAVPFQGFPRSPATLSRKGYRSWSDFGALGAINEAGHAFVVDGDCVTLYDDTWTETRYYKDGKWVEDSLYLPGVLSAPVATSQPGIDDEVKPDLMSKKLRSW